jgi:hypothetical protein
LTPAHSDRGSGDMWASSVPVLRSVQVGVRLAHGVHTAQHVEQHVSVAACVDDDRCCAVCCSGCVFEAEAIAPTRSHQVLRMQEHCSTRRHSRSVFAAAFPLRPSTFTIWNLLSTFRFAIAWSVPCTQSRSNTRCAIGVARSDRSSDVRTTRLPARFSDILRLWTFRFLKRQ